MKLFFFFFLFLIIYSCNTVEKDLKNKIKVNGAKLEVKETKLPESAVIEDETKDYVSGEYLLVTKSDLDLDIIRRVLKNVELNSIERISHNIVKIKIDENHDPGLNFLQNLVKKSKGDIKTLEHNRVFSLPKAVE